MLQRRRTQDGAVLPTSALVLCICAVAIAAAAYLLVAPSGSQQAQPTSAKVPAATKKAVPSPTATVRPHVLHKKHRKHKHHKHHAAVDRGSVNVVVFNNSNVQGLAAQTSAVAEQHGWRVVGSGNWFGTIVAPTVYYPPQLAQAAKLLASDLHIDRLRPAVEPMQFDRLTVILTSAY